MAKGSLPGYIWDSKTNRYLRVLDSGALTLVEREEIVSLLGQLAERSGKMLGDIASAVGKGYLTENDGVIAGNWLLKDLYNANSALARGGWSGMDYAAWGRNGQLLRGEYAYWRDFMKEAARGKMSEAAIRSRSNLYIGKAYSRYWDEDRRIKLADDWLHYEEWDDQDDQSECDDCHALAALGRVPLGTLPTVPGAGATRCLGGCRCVILYY